jgi:hypothetical protein
MISGYLILLVLIKLASRALTTVDDLMKHRAVTSRLFVSQNILTFDSNPGLAQFRYHDYVGQAGLATLIVLLRGGIPLASRYLELRKSVTLFRVSL